MSLILDGTNGLSDVDGSAATPAIRGSDANTGIFFPGADRIGFAEGGVQVGEFDDSGNFLMNSGYGSAAVAYGCRAWVNFDGTGTPAIRASGNVSSITDNGTGDYTVNFTTAMPDANYVAVASARQLTASGYLSVATDVNTTGSSLTRTTAAYQVQMQNVVGGLNDNPFTQIAFFR
jgi:hypothetical protein